MKAVGLRAATFLCTVFLAAPAWSQSVPAGTSLNAPRLAVPSPWQLGMQAPGSPVEQRIATLNNWVTVIIVVITLFVGGLLAFVLWRYNVKRNPVPGTVSHNSVLEAAWTALPVLILVGIFIPSLRLVYYEDRTHNADMTIKVTGHQWYWQYTYPDAGNLHFDSYMINDEDLKTDHQRALRHLLVDNQLVLPVGKNIRILTTSGDVIHSFFIPSLGVQRYAIPGRTIETWVRVDAPGDYYGECNQICGQNHADMPISVHAVSPAEFQTWLDQKKAHGSSASLDAPRPVTASAIKLASEH